MSERTGARWANILHGRLWWLIAVPILLLAAYVVVARQLMLLVPDYRQDLQQLIQRQFGVAVHIDRLSGQMDGLIPEFRMQGLTLPAEKGHSALTLDSVRVSLEVLPTLLHRQLYLRELRIRGVDVKLVRDADGRIHLRGLDALREQRPQNGAAADLLRALYRQQRIVVENARFSLDWPGLPPLAASSLNLALVNDGDSHRLSIRVQARDRPFSVDARLRVQGNPLSWDQLNARGYLDVAGERLQEWLPQQRQWPLDISRLNGRVRLWARIEHGKPRDGTLRLIAPELVLTDGKHDWPLSKLRLDAALRGDGVDHGRIAVSGVQGTTPAGDVAPGPVSVSWEHQDGQLRWHLFGQDMALHTLARQFMKWPFKLPEGVASLRQRVREQSPRGILNNVFLSGTGNRIERVQARFSDLASQSHGKAPGFSGLSGWLSATPDGGIASLQGAPLQLTLPGLYDHPLSFTLAPGAVRWRRDGQHWNLNSGALRVRNSDVHGVALFRLEAGGDIAVPRLRLLADIHDGDGARAAHYIPLQRLQGSLGDWLGQAFRGGVLDHGRFLYRGPVHIDPARQQDRTFEMRFQGHDIRLSFLPNWPAASGVTADVLIDGRKLEGTASKGKLFNSDLSDVSVTIPEVADRSLSHIVIDGQVNGPASDLERLFHDTPLKKNLPDELLDWHFQDGQMSGRLSLDMPLVKDGKSPRRVSVNGSAADVTLLNKQRNLRITGLTGPVRYDLQNGININSLDGDVLGGHFTGSWDTDDRHSRLSITGKVPVDRLRDWLGLDWLSPASGTLPVNLILNLPWHGSPFSLQADSNLQGVAVKAPAPLGKVASEARPSRLIVDGDNLDFRYDGVGRGHIRLGQHFAGALRLGAGAPPPLPQRGLDIEGRVDHASAGPWLDFITGLVPANKAGADKPAAQPSGAARVLHRVAVRVQHLDLFGLGLDNAVFSADPDSNGWALGLSSAAVAGTLRLPAEYRARGATPLTLDASRVHLPKALFSHLAKADGGQGQQGEPPVQPTRLPIMNVSLRDLEVGDEKLGDWSGQVRPAPQGVTVDNLKGQWRHVRVDGKLDWTRDAQGAQKSRFTGTLSSSDLGAALKAWNLPALVESKDANAKADLSWNNWPLAPDYTALHGTTRLDVGECRIPDTGDKTSGLRLLGILNIGTIQRRLRLDFSDLYKKGLSCDSIKGDFQFQGPVLSSSNLKIRSPSAEFAIQGHANLAQQTLDQKVEMTLPISSNLYAGCLAGPVVCAGIFVVERIWGDKLDKTTTMTYRVSGTWKDPKVKETQGMFQ